MHAHAAGVPAFAWWARGGRMAGSCTPHALAYLPRKTHQKKAKEEAERKAREAAARTHLHTQLLKAITHRALFHLSQKKAEEEAERKAREEAARKVGGRDLV